MTKNGYRDFGMFYLLDINSFNNVRDDTPEESRIIKSIITSDDSASVYEKNFLIHKYQRDKIISLGDMILYNYPIGKKASPDPFDLFNMPKEYHDFFNSDQFIYYDIFMSRGISLSLKNGLHDTFITLYDSPTNKPVIDFMLIERFYLDDYLKLVGKMESIGRMEGKLN